MSSIRSHISASAFKQGTRAFSGAVNNSNGWFNSETKNFFNSLPSEAVIVEYVWLGGEGTVDEVRSKVKVQKKVPTTASDLSDWNYDGSSTAQAPGHNSEVIIKPRYMVPHPFYPNQTAFVVMCDTYDSNGDPLPSNKRAPAAAVFEQITEEHNPMFAYEQEYSLYFQGTHLGFPEGGYPAPQGPYYCSNGANNAFGREIADAHMHVCNYMGLGVSGTNAEVMAGQWEYQIGPVVGIESADQLWISRWALHRVGEAFGAHVEFDPKTISGDWNGAGCHTNFCIKKFHLDNGEGLKNILAAMPKLEAKHLEHIECYGEGNERRLTGAHETQHIGQFSFGVADRGSSIRIPDRKSVV